MSQDDKRTRAVEAEAKEIFKAGSITGVFGLAFLALISVLVCFDVVRLHPKSYTPEKLEGFVARAEFTLKYQTLLVTWLLFGVIACIHSRLSNMAVNPLQPSTEVHVSATKNILTNSVESFLVSAFAQLIFITYADAGCVLKAIPLINVVQFVGRIAFFYGYPKYRSFGFLNTILPTTALCLYNLFHFGKFMDIY